MNLIRKITVVFITLALFISGFFALAPTKAESALTIENIAVNTEFPGANGGAQAEIKWHSTKPAYGQLRYGLKSGELNLIANTYGAPQSDYTMSLTGLKSETVYYFTIQANINSETVTSFVRSFKTKKVSDGMAPTFATN